MTNALRFSLAVAACLCLFSRSAAAGTVDDFQAALDLLKLGKHFNQPPSFQCVQVKGSECLRAEGVIGKVQLVVDLEEAVIVRFFAVIEGERAEKGILPLLERLYGAGGKKKEMFREDIESPEQGMKIPSRGQVSYEWAMPQVRIVLFAQDPALVVYHDGRTVVTEPMKTYVSGEMGKPPAIK
jgi:hypothetical protein